MRRLVQRLSVALLAGIGSFGGVWLALRRAPAPRGAPDSEPDPPSNDEAKGEVEKTDGDQEDSPAPPRNSAEKVTLAVSLGVIVLLIGAALFEQFGRTEPPGTLIEVEVRVADAVARDGSFYIPFEVRNGGTDPAQDVIVIFEVHQEGEMPEESSVTIPFLANSGSATGELVTIADPASAEITSRVATLILP